MHSDDEYRASTMTLRLTVASAAWRAQVGATRDAVAAAGDRVSLVPVVKGNGYGFGRSVLAGIASDWAPTIAVGTVHEALTTPPSGATREVLVLTPSVDPDALARLPAAAIPTVGHAAHVAALAAAGRTGRVTVKLASPMRRYGVEPDGLATLVDACTAAGLEPARWMIHPPLAAHSTNAHTVRTWLDLLDPSLPVSVSHLSAAEIGDLAEHHPRHRLELRLGTALWHGDKSALHLEADVLDVRRVVAGTSAGYRGGVVAADGSLVMVGAGSAHGVAPLDDGRSPFHFARQRLPLHEPPHMHTSMLHVPDHGQCPEVGDRVDVQRPLITTHVDEVLWQ